jgi:multidrug resistance protein, MATE family
MRRPTQRIARPAASGYASPATLGHHIRRTLVLAWPMILTRVGLVLMSTVDVVVLGRAGAGELAAYVLGQAIYDSLIAVTVGLLLGVPVLVARETGAGRDAAAGAIWRRGLVFAAVLGGSLCLVLQFGGVVFRATGQDPALAARAAR